ncbi:MAG: leucine-rich repeat domain-containing protein, partial [Ruminococcus sp.]|nr:leucine-rich repeat domain-containing protein [Ruminococcus sp.]
MNKRFVSALTALCIGLSGAGALPAGADDGPVISADNNSGLGGVCGEILWEFHSDGTLEFRGNGKMGEAAELRQQDTGWMGFSQVGEIKKVIIGDGVTNIVGSAFSGCMELDSVTIPNTVTSIGEKAFSLCTSLKSIAIPDGVTSIEQAAFFWCTSLESVDIPSSVRNIDDFAFDNCASLTSITIPDGVTRLGSCAFSMCSNLENITVPDSVTSIGAAAFSATKWLNERREEDPLVVLNNILIDGRTASGAVIVPKGVKSICDSAFSRCTELESVTFPSSLKAIEECAFEDCTSLKSVTIPASVTIIGEKAFGYEDYDSDAPIEGFTIRGYIGTAAEKYAIDNDFKFVSLGYQIGDIDQNGEVDVDDLIIMQKAVAGW